MYYRNVHNNTKCKIIKLIYLFSLLLLCDFTKNFNIFGFFLDFKPKLVLRYKQLLNKTDSIEVAELKSTW